MIPRRIILDKHGNNEYMCSGRSCDTCELRFECFTESADYVMSLDWEMLHQRYKSMSPSMALKQVVGGKVFVRGSRKFKELLYIRQQSYIKPLTKVDEVGVQIERVLEAIKKVREEEDK